MPHKGQLPRLAPEAYRGHAYIFWTYTLENRAKGWLDESFHRDFRELMLHAQSRYRLSCPIYTCMPDHIHFIWIGLGTSSDQRLASTFLRKQLNDRLSPLRLQRQPHDHILREDERTRDTFADTVRYIRLNPQRAGLTTESSPWPYAGALLPGYPTLDFGTDRFWPTFWKCHQAAQRWLDPSDGSHP
ncbi:MAG: hypothetical protein ACLFVC_01865 [Opitutales bacterium]